MPQPVHHLPDGFNSVTPYLSCEDAPAAIEYYQQVFGATEPRARLTAPDGTVMNAELDIAGTRVMIAEPAPGLGSQSPLELGATSVVLVLYVEDVDAVFAKAVAAGAEVIIELSDQFYGERTGRLRDPFGHAWIVSTRIEEVAEDEMVRRFDGLFG